jgi:DNA-binding GntR family transcriptional regulator
MRPRSIARTAYAILQDRIARGDFTPGQILSRRSIAAELGITFVPASEAFLRLEWDGLLERRPRAGTRLRIPSRQGVEQHLVISEALEAQAAMMFAERARDGEKAELLKLAERVDLQCVRRDRDRFAHAALHKKLHLRIAHASRCEALEEAIGAALARSAVWLGAIPVSMSGQPALRCHVELLASLTTGTPAQAADAMRSHIRLNGESMLRGLEPWFRVHERFGHTYSRSITLP